MKPPLVLLTGWACTADSGSDLAALLAPSFEVHALSPHDAPAGPYPDRLAHALERLATPAIVLGWSMGGMIAIQVASAMPERVRALILVSTTARFCAGESYPHGTDPRQLAAMQRNLQRNPERTLALFFARARAPIIADVGDDPLVAPAMAFGTDELARGLDYLATTDIRPMLPTLSLPALVLHGAEDAIVPVTASQFLASELPSCKLVLREETGHDFPLRYPAFVAEQVKDFIQGLPS